MFEDTRATTMNWFEFGAFRYSPLKGLFRGEDHLPLTSTELLLLEAFRQHGLHVLVKKRDLMALLWSDFGDRSDATPRLQTAMSALRRKLGDNAGDPTYIRTHHGRGYELLIAFRPVGSGQRTDDRAVSSSAQSAELPETELDSHVRLRRRFVNELRIVRANAVSRRVESEIESLIDGLKRIDIDHTLEDRTAGVSIIPRRFKWETIAAPRGTRIRRRVLLKAAHRYRWAFDFNPALKKGHKFHYRYESVLPNSQPFTFEEARRRIAAGTYKYRRPLCEAIDLIAADWVDKCVCEVVYPKGYEIVRPRCEVYVQRPLLLDPDETARMNAGGAFAVWKEFSRWHVRLTIDSPRRGRIYYVLYIAPHASRSRTALS